MNNHMIDLTLLGLRLIHGEADGLDESVSNRLGGASDEDADELATPVLFGFLFLVVWADKHKDIPWREGLGAGLSPVPDRWRVFAELALGGARDNRGGLSATEVVLFSTRAGVTLAKLISERQATETGEPWPVGRMFGNLRKQISGDRSIVAITHPEPFEMVRSSAISNAELSHRRWEVAVRFRGAITAAIDQLILATGNSPSGGEAAVIRLVATLSETVWAALNCLDSGWVYASNVLSRSIVETEMLFYRFAKEPGSWEKWALAADRQERESKWSPSAIYKDRDTDYRRVDYSTHSEHGGHPTPDGVMVADAYLGGDPEVAAATIAYSLSHMNTHLHRCTNLVYEVLEEVAKNRGRSVDSTLATDAVCIWSEFERNDPLISQSSHRAIPDKRERTSRR